MVQDPTDESAVSTLTVTFCLGSPRWWQIENGAHLWFLVFADRVEAQHRSSKPESWVWIQVTAVCTAAILLCAPSSLLLNYASWELHTCQPNRGAAQAAGNNLVRWLFIIPFPVCEFHFLCFSFLLPASEFTLDYLSWNLGCLDAKQNDFSFS